MAFKVGSVNYLVWRFLTERKDPFTVNECWLAIRDLRPGVTEQYVNVSIGDLTRRGFAEKISYHTWRSLCST